MKENMQDINIRLASKSDLPFLREILYEAAYWRTDQPRPDIETALQREDLCYLLDEWSRAGDLAIIAEDHDHNPIAAAWYRFWTESKHSYGYINDDIPELAIAVIKKARGKGVATKLLEKLLTEAVNRNISQISLSVEKDNHAVKLYKKVGFVVHKENPDDFVMIWKSE